jgi:oxaloacetate decarboxylase (Na+ extruding) subunit gamma
MRMNEIFGEAFLLMIVGMTTVFAILFLVVGMGNVLIRIINRYFPEPLSPAKVPARTAIEPARLAVIAAAVAAVTGGKGHIEQIEKKS